jgi:predicted ATP-dependent serine protease
LEFFGGIWVKMTDMIFENQQTVEYVLDRFIQAEIESNQIIAITRTMKNNFGVSSEDEVEELVKEYLNSIGYVSKVD